MKPKDAALRAMALTVSFDVAMAGLAMTLAHFAMVYSAAEVLAFPLRAWIIAALNAVGQFTFDHKHGL